MGGRWQTEGAVEEGWQGAALIECDYLTLEKSATILTSLPS